MILRRFFYSLAYFFLLGIPAFVLGFFVKNELNLGAIFFVTGISLLVGGVFDIWAVKQGKNDDFYIWEYNAKSILGFKLYGVPIEDYVFFFIFTPFFIIIMYEAVKKYLYLQDGFIFAAFFALVLVIAYHYVWRYAIRKRKQ